MLLISSREYRIGGGGGDRAVACDRVNRLETRCTEVLVRRTAEEIIAAPGVITEHSELEKGRIPSFYYSLSLSEVKSRFSRWYKHIIKLPHRERRINQKFMN